MDYIESRIKKLFSEALALENDVAIHKLDWSEWELRSEKLKPELPEHLFEGDDRLLVPFLSINSDIYLSVLKYLDDQKLDNYIREFYKIFGTDSASPKDHDNFEYDHYYSGEFYCIFLKNIRKFLSVFSFFESDFDRMERLTGLKYLETILGNTGVITSKLPSKPTSEPAVYKAVKSVMEPIFPKAKYGKSSFNKLFKTYHPDILIPELSAAIEYKYASSETVLKKTIEEILIDVKGYTGDRDYNLFYAVFYVTSDIIGKEKFKAVWDEYDFPSNWIPFYIVG